MDFAGIGPYNHRTAFCRRFAWGSTMGEERAQRRLAAILAADVVGFSRLIEASEAMTLAALKDRRRNVLVPLVAQHHGRVVKVMGDGVLVEFASAVNAVACAAELQQRMEASNAGLAQDRRITLRIGVNLGDLVVEGGDLYGDGVNVAARLQAIAGPGQICVSGSVYDQVKRKLAMEFEDLGVQQMKNIAEPVSVYRVIPGMVGAPGEAKGMLPLPAKPSIAVLPFVNMSGEPEQESFVDGITEDLITDLSRDSALFVIARNSAFVYKGKPVDVRRIAQDLGVRYLVEGSARRAAGRVRINAQLIDAAAGDHLWAERFDRTLEDIFAVQDEVTGKIVEALAGRLTAGPARNRPASLAAYDLCVKARGLYFQNGIAAREACYLLERAIAIDPNYAEAHRWLALNIFLASSFWDATLERQRGVSEAERAVAIDPNDAGNHWVLAIVLGHQRRFEEAEAEFEHTFRLDPNHADGWAMRSDLRVMAGHAAEAMEFVRKAFRLNPHPPGWYYWMLGQAQYIAGDSEAAVSTLRHPETYRTTSRRTLAAALADLGRLDDARMEAELFMMSNPGFTISYWANWQPFQDDNTRRRFVEGYRKAGLPD